MDFSLAWLVVVGGMGAVLGGWLGNLVARVRSKSAERIRELEAELESAHDTLAEYRREVFDQFAETARKFKSLDESYNDLHRQLAESANLLCGEAAGPLLAAPAPQQVLAVEETDEAVAQAPDAVIEKLDDGEEPPEIVVEPLHDTEEVPILLSEATEPDAANGASVATPKVEPRRADDAA